jgi:hypothetical protein
MIDMNRYGKKREAKSPDFYLLASFLLEIGDHLGPVPIHSEKGRYDENKREQEYRDDSNRDQAGSSPDGHGDLHKTVVFGATRRDARSWTCRRFVTIKSR